MTKPACKDCRFWETYEDMVRSYPELVGGAKYVDEEVAAWRERNGENANGDCQRFPPSAHGADGSVFPETLPHEWCGEFKPRDAIGTVDVDKFPTYDKAMTEASVRLRNMLDTLGIDGWPSFLEVFAKKSAPGFDPTYRSHIVNVVLSQKNSGKTMARELIIRLDNIGWPFRKDS